MTMNLLTLTKPNILSMFFLAAAILSAAYLVYFVILLIKNHGENEAEIGKNTASDYTQSSVNNTERLDSRGFMTHEIRNSIRKAAKQSEIIKVGLSSIIGTRKYQQDSAITIDENTMRKTGYKKCIAVLCDGMGGMEGGEIASAISAKTLFDDYMNNFPENVPAFFRSEVKKLDRIVCGLTNEKNEVLNSGSTLVSVVIEEGKMYWVSVGDSRIYVIRGGKMVQITTDHNYYYILRQQAESGKISFEEAANNPKGEALISYIGLGRDGEIGGNEQPIPLEPGDLILLCSDGLYKALSDQEICDIANTCQNNVAQVANMLTAATMTKQRKSQDNTSVVLLKYNGIRNR